MTTIAAPVRQEPSLYPVLIEQPVRYSDLDPSRRIGRDAIVRWFEDARLAVERDVFEADLADRSPLRTLVASVRVEVLAPLRWGRRYRVGVGASRVGQTSYSYAFGVFADDECVAVGESTNVHITDSGPAPLPAAVREALTAVAVPAAEVGRPDRDPARLVREAYPFRLDIRTRFGDLDTNRHVNNVALAGWYLDALAELHLDVLGYPTGGPLDGLSPSSLTVEYLDEVCYPAIYQLRVGVLDLDDTSVRYACGLFDGPRCIGLAEAVGAHAAPARTGDEIIELAAAFEPFRMREV
ncbi:thioesterase family protein [Pseudonocardia sp. H11422]|uniref:thioesterase family protein n=1 Tax=Pseudonocardia sp. H11422 TaxID=2835866 RepID=UPI001BDC632D|nr:thioesterase family protein [Pseudonocardia sp. H11422]